MLLTFAFSLNFLVIYLLSRKSNFNIWQPFLIINFNALLALVIGGDLSHLFRDYHYSVFEIKVILFTVFNIPVLFIFLFGALFKNKAFKSSVISKEEVQLLKRFSSKAFKPFLFIYPIIFGINLLIMLKEGVMLRSYYQYAVANNFGILYSISTICGIFFTLQFVMQKRYFLATFGLLSVVLLGKKSPVLLIILIPFIYDILTKRKISIKILLIMFFGLIGLIGLGKAFTETNLTGLEQLSSTLDYYYNFGYFLEKYPLGEDKGKIFLTSFYLYLPRFLWSAKPLVYGFLLIHEKLFYKEMMINFYPSVFEEYAMHIADFGLINGIIAIILIKTTLYVFLLLRKTSLWIRLFLIMNVFDPTVALVLILMIYQHIRNEKKYKYRLP